MSHRWERRLDKVGYITDGPQLAGLDICAKYVGSRLRGHLETAPEHCGVTYGVTCIPNLASAEAKKRTKDELGLKSAFQAKIRLHSATGAPIYRGTVKLDV